MALEHIDPYPWFLNKTLELVVNEQMVRTRITASEWADCWRPFLARFYDLWIAHHPKRFLIAIAGPPGAGKSVFAEQLHFIIDKGILHRDAHTVALPMDGFLYPKAYLESHTRTLPDGATIFLASARGQPDTIDIVRLRSFIQSLIARPEYVAWPGYSRFSRDVIPEKFKVHMSVNVVIIEGSYLLVHRGPFQGLPELFDLRIYVDAPAPKIIANLMDRHIRTGQNLEEAKDWVKRVDLPNARIAESSRHQADVIFERDTDNDIASVTWRGEEKNINSKRDVPEEPFSAPEHPAHADTHHTPHPAPPPSHPPFAPDAHQPAPPQNPPPSP